MPNENPTSPFSAKDWVSFVFSAIALTLSVFSVYVTQYKVTDDLKGRIVTFNFDPLMKSKEGRTLGSVGASTVFYNSGNRPAIVTQADLTISLLKGSVSSRDPSDPTPFPFILQPHDARLVELKIPYEQFSISYGELVPDASKLTTYQFNVGLRIQAIDSGGVLHTVERYNLRKVQYVGGYSFRAAPGPVITEYPLISVFKERSMSIFVH